MRNRNDTQRNATKPGILGGGSLAFITDRALREISEIKANIGLKKLAPKIQSNRNVGWRPFLWEWWPTLVKKPRRKKSLRKTRGRACVERRWWWKSNPTLQHPTLQPGFCLNPGEGGRAGTHHPGSEVFSLEGGGSRDPKIETQKKSNTICIDHFTHSHLSSMIHVGQKKT